MYTGIVSSLLFPLHEHMKKHRTVAIRRRLESSQWWSAADLDSLRLRRLRALLQDAAVHVPYYRDAFARHGFDAATLNGLADLERVPFLTKPLIRAHTEALMRDGATDLQRFNTGGSSGEPLVFHIGRERISHDVAAKWRATRWWGVDIGDRELVVWGSPIELGVQDRVRQWRDRVLRTELISAFEMSAAKLDEIVETLRLRRPKMLFGYPSALARIARHAEARGIALDGVGIEVAFVTAERLYDNQREAIARVFGCRVANGYGSRDAGFIAHECPAGGMHITAEDIIVEVIGADGRTVPRGAAGEIVVTHLATRDFPFIRYRTGDIARLDEQTPCPCGRGLPLLADIQGRSTDFVVAADGTVMHGLALIYVVRDLPGVRAFKVVQETLGRTTVLLAVDATFDRANVEVIVAGFRRRLGASVDVNVEFVDHIGPEKSGKYRYVVSHAAAAAGAA
jgi:phenylacetate-CoA ligase